MAKGVNNATEFDNFKDFYLIKIYQTKNEKNLK